jgi:pimeloyl-ACP methyl ester carboxylesterase
MPRAQINGFAMAHEDHGHGLPLVLVHGFPLGRWIWDGPRAALISRYRVVTPDLRGHGESEVPDGPYLMEQHAQDVLALLDHLGIERFVLGGLSMGGYVGFAILRLAAERVRALLLFDTRSRADSEAERQGREANAQLALGEGSGRVVERMLPALLGATTRRERPDLVEDVRRRLSATAPASIAAALRGMAARPDSTALLGTLALPTLIVVGSEDTLTPPAEAEAMHAAIAGSRLRQIAGAGHLSTVEQPETVSAALAEFLGGLVW